MTNSNFFNQRNARHNLDPMRNSGLYFEAMQEERDFAVDSDSDEEVKEARFEFNI